MANAYGIKADVINELRNRIYYNQMEIQRLLENPVGQSHKDIINTLGDLLSENFIAANSIDLLEQYLPTQQKTAEPQSEPQSEPQDYSKLIKL
jgi:hypothetical protein